MTLYTDCVAMVTSTYKWLLFEPWQGERGGRKELHLGFSPIMATQRQMNFIDFPQRTFVFISIWYLSALL